MANPALQLCLTKFWFSLNCKLFSSLCVPKNKVTLTVAGTAKTEERNSLPTGLLSLKSPSLKIEKHTNKQTNIYLQSFTSMTWGEMGFFRKYFPYHFMKLNLPSHSVLQCVMFALQMFSYLSGILLPTALPLFKSLICALNYLASTSIFQWKQTGGGGSILIASNM